MKIKTILKKKNPPLVLLNEADLEKDIDKFYF
ncbi:hypothetical protein M493_13140 [Geobacillus genomosp. 3]|uniref:Uncharacterized protein n=1 Tax=Geobacillus genomosp. 3 TaxID=1921421 RepID=S5Z7S7_GEOG3|nr:hypothetical protein M493_13140 [Geobacillus genomosp. 3]